MRKQSRTPVNELITLLELSKELNVGKATLIYYTQLGLFKPDEIIGKTLLFKKKTIMNRWRDINKLRKTNTLSQIREIFEKK
jgi:DNA-binding transcriptional MerR regulator